MAPFRYFKNVQTVRLRAQPAITTTEKFFADIGVIWFGPNFRSQFLGLETRAVGPTELEIHALRKPVRSAEIEEEVTEISMVGMPEVTQVRELIPESRRREERSFSRLIGMDGNIWVVWYWYDTSPSGWYLGANPVQFPCILREGDKFISSSRRPVVTRYFASA